MMQSDFAAATTPDKKKILSCGTVRKGDTLGKVEEVNVVKEVKSAKAGSEEKREMTKENVRRRPKQSLRYHAAVKKSRRTGQRKGHFKKEGYSLLSLFRQGNQREKETKITF